MNRAARTPRERGEAAVELVAGLALLLAPVVALAVALPGWAEARYVVDAAAVEAGRVAAHHGDAEAAAALAARVVANHGFDDPPQVDVDLPVGAGGRLARHGHAVARVTVDVPAMQLPAVGALGGWTLTGEHHEPLDPWRGVGDG